MESYGNPKAISLGFYKIHKDNHMDILLHIIRESSGNLIETCLEIMTESQGNPMEIILKIIKESSGNPMEILRTSYGLLYCIQIL